MSEAERFETFCHSNNILINLVTDLSTKIRGYCYYDGYYYNVMLNAKLCGHQIQKTAMHEIVHVLQNHFVCPSYMVEEVEMEVDEIVNTIYNEFIIEFSFV